jgi:hypothetical protein
LNILQETITENIDYTTEGIVYNTTHTGSFANGENTEIWHLTTLKNKEMVLEGTLANTGADNQNEVYMGSVYTWSSNSSETGTISGTLLIE